ncbi:hypothetical protein, partial [Streptococcus agalactiae]
VDIPGLLASTDIKFGWPGLDGNLVNKAGEPLAGTTFNLQWLSSPGTLIAITALVVAAVYSATSSEGAFPLTFKQGIATLFKTI